jgi:hypothetical protein
LDLNTAFTLFQDDLSGATVPGTLGEKSPKACSGKKGSEVAGDGDGDASLPVPDHPVFGIVPPLPSKFKAGDAWLQHHHDVESRVLQIPVHPYLSSPSLLGTQIIERKLPKQIYIIFSETNQHYYTKDFMRRFEIGLALLKTRILLWVTNFSVCFFRYSWKNCNFFVGSQKNAQKNRKTHRIII